MSRKLIAVLVLILVAIGAYTVLRERHVASEKPAESPPRLVKTMTLSAGDDSFKQGRTQRLGPYYKYQRWEQGRNLSRRVPQTEAPSLRMAIEGYHRYEALAKEYAELTIQMTRQAAPTDAKKKPTS